jgi:hypothetical protein
MAYFGFDNNGITAFTKAGSFGVVGTCPGSGNQTIDSIGGRLSDGGEGLKFRCAIYTSNGATLLTSGAAKKDQPDAEAWAEQTNAELSSPPYLIGGTNYLIVVSVDSTNFRVAGSGASVISTASSYVDGFPSSISLGTSEEYPECIRCGVSPAAVGGGGGGLVGDSALVGDSVLVGKSVLIG